MGGGKHPRWAENASVQLQEHTAPLSWEDCWELDGSRKKGENGALAGFNYVEAKALPVLEEQANLEGCSVMCEEQSDEAPTGDLLLKLSAIQTMVGRKDVEGFDASLSKTSVENSVKSEPEELSWLSEPGQLPKIKGRSFQSEESSQESPNSGKFEEPLAQPAVLTEKEKWRTDMQKKILRQKEDWKAKAKNIQDMRDRVLSYRPGAWLLEAGGMKRNSYDIPDVTTLLVVGPMGAGKSTLINNMIRVVNNKISKFDRAQVCGDLTENGTYFLHEHMLCDGSESICVYDSRGLSEVDTADALSILRSWLEQGIRHGQMVVRSSDSNITRYGLESKARHGHSKISKKRTINFVIFVVNAVSLNNMRRSADWASRLNLMKLIKSPFLTFTDDRPVVVMTHGDELCLEDRLQARIFLGEMIGFSPADQVFDVSGFTGRVVNEGDVDPSDDIALLDMLEYALERADRNLPYKQPKVLNKVCSHAYEHLVKVKHLSAYCREIFWQTLWDAWNADNPSCLRVVLVLLIGVWSIVFLSLLVVLNMKWISKVILVARSIHQA